MRRLIEACHKKGYERFMYRFMVHRMNLTDTSTLARYGSLPFPRYRASSSSGEAGAVVIGHVPRRYADFIKEPQGGGGGV
ncbi:hypothetical protein EYF80_038547 [Liparis tanakae]|uniref:Uncharacterized protein n=1 Tax=Liparis tanakae TaxID=230148 RepID=A0A4Z2GCE2_9TELE|nr:hypothetical protein EYF80_038547 [Liparis tanakae]